MKKLNANSQNTIKNPLLENTLLENTLLENTLMNILVKAYLSVLFVTIYVMMIQPSYSQDRAKYYYLSSYEKLLIKEINYARMYPQNYAQKFIKPIYDKLDMSKAVKGSDSFELAVYTAYHDLMNTRPMNPVRPDPGITAGVRDHILDPLRDRPHHSARESQHEYYENTATFMSFYGERRGSSGEILFATDFYVDCKNAFMQLIRTTTDKYGRQTKSISYKKTNSIILEFIIDHWNEDTDWGHRKNILNPDFTKVGTGMSYGAGPVYSDKFTTIIAFAENFQANEQIKRDINWIAPTTTWKTNHGPTICPTSGWQE